MLSEPLPFEVTSDIERAIVDSPEWQTGCAYGTPRPGHPEGQVLWHVAEVLANVEKLYGQHPLRSALRLIALVHDTFKCQVDPKLPKTATNHHGWYARRFAERYMTDGAMLEVIELHDEAYNAWQNGSRDGKWDKAERRAKALIQRLGPTLPLYLAFFDCDNLTGDKDQAPVTWFRQLAADELCYRPRS